MWVAVAFTVGAFWAIFSVVDVEDEIEELKELVEKNLEVTQETNRMVRIMRRNATWGWIFQIVWWLVVAGVTGAAYYYYVQPYVMQIEHLYGISQQQTQNWNNQIGSFFKFLSQHGVSSSTSTPVEATTTPR